MDIKVLNAELATQECDVLVVGMFKEEDALKGVFASVNDALNGIIKDFVLDKDNFDAKFGHTYLLQTYGKIPANKVLVVGLGERDKFTLNKLREVSAKILKKSQMIKAKKICVDLGDFSDFHFDCFEIAQVVAEGTLIADYSFDKYKSKKKDYEVEEFALVEADERKFAQLVEGAERGVKIADAMTITRNLVNEPAEFSTPSKLAEVAKKLEGVKTKIFERNDVEKMGMGAFAAVGRGSDQPLKFIHMKYTPKNPKKKIALVGKGITFDSGGYNLKPPASMLNMKTDMSGAACVLGVMGAISALNPNVEVHAVIAACENLVDGKAYKPGDVLTAKNGKTIEIDNTDAEGRLTLADALCYVCDEIEVDEVVDIATLTGAVMVALGTHAAGIMGNSQTLIDDLIKVGEKSGERFWQLPMYEEFQDGLKSEVADMRNTGSRYGGSSAAGVFLQNFVKDVDWVHLDIAGVAFLDKPQKELAKGATGAGVRTLLNYILSI